MTFLAIYSLFRDVQGKKRKKRKFLLPDLKAWLELLNDSDLIMRGHKKTGFVSSSHETRCFGISVGREVAQWYSTILPLAPKRKRLCRGKREMLPRRCGFSNSGCVWPLGHTDSFCRVGWEGRGKEKHAAEKMCCKRKKKKRFVEVRGNRYRRGNEILHDWRQERNAIQLKGQRWVNMVRWGHA